MMRQLLSGSRGARLTLVIASDWVWRVLFGIRVHNGSRAIVSFGIQYIFATILRARQVYMN